VAKGVSNNPRGRPPKELALTTLLMEALCDNITLPDGEVLAKKVLLSRLVTQVLTTGRVQFPGDPNPLVVGAKDWMDFVRWAYSHLEPPTSRAILQHQFEEIEVTREPRRD
jgi:hypothetical protein